MKYVLQLVRWSNLVIVFMVQYLFAYCMIAPFQPIFSKNVFYAVALACVLTAASGNVINDYYDRDIDAINKPDKVYIGKHISLKTALFLYFLCNVLAIVLAVYADYVQYSCCTTAFVVGSIVLLWLYSRYFKKSYLLGNIVVAFLSMAPMLLLTVLEVQDFGKGVQYPFLLLFMFFSFWTSLIREMLKDCEDREGDLAAGAKTIPIVNGIAKTKVVVAALIVVMLGVLVAFGMTLYMLGNLILVFYIVLLVVLFGVLLAQVMQSNSAADFHRVSSFTKVVMLVGMVLMPLMRCFGNFFY
ncbi:MAG: geranylgeranylglycerol-phosphate geranylgeranyltransferase [Chitinophagaceae bacterium]